MLDDLLMQFQLIFLQGKEAAQQGQEVNGTDPYPA